MPETFRPATESELAETLAWAAAERTPLAVHGNNSKAGLGRPVQADYGLELSGLAGITLYEPEELVMRAAAGTPLAEVNVTLAEARQQLAFEPPELAPLYGDGAATIGGVFACNLSGPRRIQAGAARDHLLGVRAVSGRGEVFKSGGRVVKNVSGYDLSKVMAGSYGTLAALSEVTFKVVPAPEKTRTVLAVGLDVAAAVRILCQAATTPCDVSGLAHVSAGPAARSGVDFVAGAGGSVTAIRVEGTEASVAYRFAKLKALAADVATTIEELHRHNSERFWREVGSAALIDDGRAALWRISVAPTDAPAALERLAPAGEAVLDWSGGLIWLAVAAGDDAGADRVRGTVAEVGGHATLVRAPDAIRAAIDVFQPQPAPLARLSARLKEGFDPHGILNPGRMYPGV